MKMMTMLHLIISILDLVPLYASTMQKKKLIQTVSRLQPSVAIALNCGTVRTYLFSHISVNHSFRCYSACNQRIIIEM